MSVKNHEKLTLKQISVLLPRYEAFITNNREAKDSKTQNKVKDAIRSRYFLEDIREIILRKQNQNEFERRSKSLIDDLMPQKSDTPANCLVAWHEEMMKYCKQYDGLSDPKENRLFFYVKYLEDSNSRYKLSFGTRYCGVCTRIGISMDPVTLPDQSYSYKLHSSLGLENLNDKGIAYLNNNKRAEDFVTEVIWAEISKLHCSI